MQKEYVSIEEALEYLGLTRTTLYKLVREGTLTTYKIGGGKRTYLKRDEILEAFAPGVSRSPKTQGHLALQAAS